ncbi:unnamed protein product [Tuber melanosporum]|uniref:(Perigord truffle) hypothetical protein n=1 Tax=Tuber melanosporum (strain Mel28) TaxID=656061 RepID=D5GGV5_TUBMM|nr:uncharacterized protein GSTUM_00002051001 [Tuber melanosporum]CAZ83748.1 unnamed protein product [Tuber melanosporum]
MASTAPKTCYPAQEPTIQLQKPHTPTSTPPTSPTPQPPPYSRHKPSQKSSPMPPSTGSSASHPPQRIEILKSLHNLLVPSGTFAAEFGAHGNCAEVHTALIAALVHRGVAVEVVREACLWWLPTEEEVRKLWGEAGFVVESLRVELRQTELPQGDIGGWVRLFGNAFLELVHEGEREGVVKEVMSVLESVGRVGGGSGVFRINYIRCRILARRGV